MPPPPPSGHRRRPAAQARPHPEAGDLGPRREGRRRHPHVELTLTAISANEYDELLGRAPADQGAEGAGRGRLQRRHLRPGADRRGGHRAEADRRAGHRDLDGEDLEPGGAARPVHRLRQPVQPGPGRPFHARRLRYDPTFALEVRWCSDHGLPHSALLGWDRGRPGQAGRAPARGVRPLPDVRHRPVGVGRGPLRLRAGAEHLPGLPAEGVRGRRRRGGQPGYPDRADPAPGRDRATGDATSAADQVTP